MVKRGLGSENPFHPEASGRSLNGTAASPPAQLDYWEINEPSPRKRARSNHG
jgi:hypothetical protein